MAVSGAVIWACLRAEGSSQPWYLWRAAVQLQLSDQHRLVQSSSRLLGCKVQGQLIGDTLALLALAVAEFHGHGVAEGLEFRVQAGRCALGRYFKLQRVQSCRAARAAAFASMFAVFCGGGLQRRVLGQDGGDLPCRDSL